MNIFVAKLNFNTQEEELLKLFEGYGEVTSCKIIFDKFTGKSKGFGFVEMSDDTQAQEAINSLNETEFDGRNIVVKEARPREERRNNRNFNSGGGGSWNRNSY